MAFEILAKLGLNATGFQSGLKRAESAGTAFSNSLKTRIAGAFSVAAVATFTKSVIAAADKIGDLADQTGLAVDQIQELTAMAGKSGLEFPVFQQFIEKLRDARREAMDGKKEFESIFSQVGIDAEELATITDPGELLQRFARGFAKFNEEGRNAIASAIGGTRAGGKLSSTIAAIGRGETSGELKFTERQVAQASKIDNAAASLWRQTKVAVFNLFSNPYPKDYLENIKKEVEAKRALAELNKRDPLKTGQVFQPFVKQPQPEDEAKQEEQQAPDPRRQFQQDINALQRIGAEIIGAEGNVWERRQLDVQMKMERHLNDIRNRGDTAFP